MLLAIAVLLAVDLWYVALYHPATLGPGSLAWLAGLYAIAGAGATFVLRGVLRCSAATARGVLVCGALVLGAAEVVLETLDPLAAAGPWLVAWLAIAALLTARPLGRRLDRRPSPWMVALGTAVLVLGAVGAVRGFGAATTPSRAARPAPGAPSFLVVLIDTLRADHLGCYGYSRATSPMLDRLATEGALFERAYALSSWTKPSTASLLTGRLPTQHRVVLERSRLPDAELTIAEALSARGYATATFSANPWVSAEYGFAQGVDHFVTAWDEGFEHATLFMRTLRRAADFAGLRRSLYDAVARLVQGEHSGTAADTKLVRETTAWIAGRRGEPFFAYVHLMSPHRPYDPPPPFDRFVTERAGRPVIDHPRKDDDFMDGRGDPLDARAQAEVIARYDGEVLYADTEVGRLLGALDDLGLASTTVVLVTADHGEEFYEHGNWGHGQSVYEELIHVPLLVRYPGRIPGGTRIARIVTHGDVLPTLLALAGAPTEASLLEGSNDAEAVTELLQRDGEARAIVAGDRKLVTRHRGEVVRTDLYDLSVDPREQAPLAATTPVASALGGRLAARIVEAERTRGAVADAVVSDLTAERLRALGYAR